jgi:apolipoprotein N-acyltransferase
VDGYPLPHDVRWVYTSREPLPPGTAETAGDAVDADGRTADRDRNAAMRGFSTPVLFGVITGRDRPDFPGEQDTFNTAVLIDRDGRVVGRYDKTYLLIFGEYLPFADWFPFLKKWLPEAGDFSPGTSVETFDFEGVRLGILICYEDIIPAFGRKLAAKSPDILLNLTNDAWFGKTAEPYLHLQLATFRAIENRRYLLRSTNTGVSAVVDPVGRIVKQTSLDDAETVLADVAVMSGETIYQRYGDVFAWASCGIAVVLLALGLRRKG